MDKLGTYALVAALRGLAESGNQTRQTDNDRWISLQASTLPQLALPAEDTPQPVEPAEQALPHKVVSRPYIRTSYLKEINKRHDAANRKRGM